jgi:hypothetical protein
MIIMKYDPEYDSYKFCRVDMDILINALEFYRQYNPSEQAQSSYISILIKDLEKSCVSDQYPS